MFQMFQGKHTHTNMNMFSHKLTNCNTYTCQTDERVVQAYLQHVYVTFGGSISLTTDNRKELKNTLFQKVHHS